MRLVAFLMLVAASGLALAQTPRSVGKDLMVKELPDLTGREALVRANVYPPGTSNP
ncbi:MAG: cupin, partial [Betaproteobacteria bacterium]